MENIRKMLNKVAQFIMKLEQAGFELEWMNQVVNSKSNDLAKNVVKLFSGDYELIRKSPLVKDGLMIVKAFSGDITELFSENKTEKDKQWHSESFLKLLKSLGTKIETLEIKVQKYVLEKRMSCYGIRDFIDLEKLVFKTKKQAFAVLNSIMIDKYCDGKINIVYYLDENGELCYAYCGWDADYAEWYCDADSADAREWPVGDRVFYPAI